MPARVRRNRAALRPLRRAIGTPPPFSWTGNIAFARLRKSKFERLSGLLQGNDLVGLCTAIGLVEVHWAMMEQQLERWIQLVWHLQGGRTLEKTIPRAFKQKTNFLRRAFKSIPMLHVFALRAEEILSHAEGLAATRHGLTHAVVSHTEASNGRFILKKLKLDANAKSTLDDFVFDVANFPALTSSLSKLVTDAIEMSADLIAAYKGAK